MGEDRLDDGRDLVRGDAPFHDPTVVGVAKAGIVSVVVDEDAWDLYDSMVGVTPVLVLLAYGRFRRQTVATRSEAVAVGAVWAICLVLIVGFAIDGFQVWLGWPPLGSHAMFDGFWFCVVWVVPTAVVGATLHNAGELLLHPRHRRLASSRPQRGAG